MKFFTSLCIEFALFSLSLLRWFVRLFVRWLVVWFICACYILCVVRICQILLDHLDLNGICLVYRTREKNSHLHINSIGVSYNFSIRLVIECELRTQWIDRPNNQPTVVCDTGPNSVSTRAHASHTNTINQNTSINYSISLSPNIKVIKLNFKHLDSSIPFPFPFSVEMAKQMKIAL